MKKTVLILSIVFLTGCATVQTRRTEFVKAHTELAPEQRDAIMKGAVITGMSRDMVIATWGEPIDEVNEIINGNEVKSWIFQAFVGDHVNIYAVKFTNELVSEVRLISVQKRTYGYPEYYSPIHTQLYFLYGFPHHDDHHHHE